jgi:hypothetical protein
MITSMSRSLRRLAVLVLVAGTACADNKGASEAAPTPSEAKPAAVTTPAAPALPSAEQLLAEAVEAMGGAARFDALKSFYTESTLSMKSLGLTGVARTWWRGGDFYNESEMPGVGQMKIGGLAGKAWGDDPISGLRALADKEAEQAMWSATLCLAHDWRRYFKSAETTGVKEVDGKKLAEINFTSPLGDVVVLRIDMATKLPVSESFTQVSPLGSMPATVYFKDFREVEGFKIPFEQVVDASLTQAVSTTVKVEFNVAVDDAKFAMPGAREAVVPGALEDAAKVDPSKAAVEPEKPVKGKSSKPAK